MQAVEEVFQTLEPVVKKRPELIQVLERLVEPERVVSFRVAWQDDKQKQHVNRGFRSDFN